MTAVEKVFFTDGREEIVAIGNNRRGWKLTVASAIHRINKKQCAFFVTDHMCDRRAYLGPTSNAAGHILLGTKISGLPTDHLFHLPALHGCNVID